MARKAGLVLEGEMGIEFWRTEFEVVEVRRGENKSRGSGPRGRGGRNSLLFVVVVVEFFRGEREPDRDRDRGEEFFRGEGRRRVGENRGPEVKFVVVVCRNVKWGDDSGSSGSSSVSGSEKWVELDASSCVGVGRGRPAENGTLGPVVVSKIPTSPVRSVAEFFLGDWEVRAKRWLEDSGFVAGGA